MLEVTVTLSILQMLITVTSIYLFGCCQIGFKLLKGEGRQTGRLADEILNFEGHIRVFHEVGLGVFSALAQEGLTVPEIGPAFVNQFIFNTQIENVADFGDAFVVHDVKFGLGEGWGNLVLLNLDPRPVANHISAGFQALNPANVEPDGGVELQGIAAAGRLRVAEHDSNLHP